MKKEIKRIFKKNKRILLPGVLLFAAFFIIIRIILPQIDLIKELKNKIELKKTDIAYANKLSNMLFSISESQLADYYETSTTAVPMQKNLTLMFLALTNAAEKANVELGGFTFNAGNVYSATVDLTYEKVTDGIPFVNIMVIASGKQEKLIKFGDELYSSLPLTQVNSINIRDGKGSFDVNFYFMPNLKQNPAEKGAIASSFTSEEKTLLKTLSEWK